MPLTVLNPCYRERELGMTTCSKYHPLRFHLNILGNFLLKGVCHEIFDLYFFHDSNPSWAPGKQVFEFGFDFAEIFDLKVRKIRLCSLHHTADSKF